MNNNITTSILIAIFLITAILGCIPSKPGYEVKILQSDRLIKKLEGNRRKIKTFKGTGVLNIDTPKLSAKANFEVILKKPDSIKISVFGPFGIDLAQALLTKGNFKFYDVIKNELYTGMNREAIIKNIMKIDISFDDLMDAFAGAVNLTDKLRREPDDYKLTDERYILTYYDLNREKKSVYDINIKDLAITNYKLISKPDKIIFEGAYTDFKEFNNVPIPYNTVVRNKVNRQSVEIEYRSIEVNNPIDGISIMVPKDVKIIEW